MTAPSTPSPKKFSVRRLMKQRRRLVASRASTATGHHPVRRSDSSPTCTQGMAPRSSPASTSPSPLGSGDHSMLSGAEWRQLTRLAALLPPSLRVPNLHADPVQIVENASRYIAQLSSTVVCRVRNGSLPEDALSRLISPPSSSGGSPPNGCRSRQPVWRLRGGKLVRVMQGKLQRK